MKHFHFTGVHSSCIPEPFHQLSYLVFPLLDLLPHLCFYSLQLFEVQLQLFLFCLQELLQFYLFSPEGGDQLLKPLLNCLDIE